jgi:tRNA pseudouridine38-40 synthase
LILFLYISFSLREFYEDDIVETMKKTRLLIEYDGSAYHGWQVQDDALTIQGILEDRVQRLTQAPTKVLGASRTDAGVHAIGQVACFSAEISHDAEVIHRALNATLPSDIRILDVSDADVSFNPRNDALKKSYLYIIANERKSSVFLQRYAALVRQKLKTQPMRQASQDLLGEHDFASFMGAGSGIKDPVRTVHSLTIEQLEELEFMTVALRGNFIRIRIEANGFLRHMVRNIVGTLIRIGRGMISPDGMKFILESKDRTLAGETAPANGLFLERIVY